MSQIMCISILGLLTQEPLITWLIKFLPLLHILHAQALGKLPVISYGSKDRRCTTKFPFTQENSPRLKLSTNLVPIWKFTNDIHCYIIFYNTHCIFQDQNSGKQYNLYYLRLPNYNYRKPCVLVTKGLSQNTKTI